MVQIPQDSAASAIAHTIGLAIAPVFLISGIGAILAVLTSRLGRIVDRARVLETEPPGEGQEGSIARELKMLFQRAKLINESITLCTITALLISAVIAILFLGAFLQFDISVPVALLFIGGMVSFFLGLLAFLREIFMATASLRIGPHRHRGSGITPVPGVKRDVQR